jgi:hypothetical protein
VPETIRFKYRAFLSYSHPDTRSTDMTGLQAELEAAFRKLPIAPPDDGRIPYERLIPGIGRQLALMKPVDRKVASPDATKRKLVALKKHAKILCEDMSAMALLPPRLRILIVEIAHAEDPKLPPPAGRGAPQKSQVNAGCPDCGGALLWPDGHKADPHHADGRRQSPWSISRVLSNNIQDFRHQGFG